MQVIPECTPPPLVLHLCLCSKSCASVVIECGYVEFTSLPSIVFGCVLTWNSFLALTAQLYCLFYRKNSTCVPNIISLYLLWNLNLNIHSIGDIPEHLHTPTFQSTSHIYIPEHLHTSTFQSTFTHLHSRTPSHIYIPEHLTHLHSRTPSHIYIPEHLTHLHSRTTSHIYIPEHLTHLHSRTPHTSTFQSTSHIYIPEHLTHLHSRTPHTSTFQSTSHIYIPEHLTHLHSRTPHTPTFQNTSHIYIPELVTYIRDVIIPAANRRTATLNMYWNGGPVTLVVT